MQGPYDTCEVCTIHLPHGRDGHCWGRMLEDTTPLAWLLPGYDVVPAWSPVLRLMFTSTPHHVRVGGGLDEHPNSQQGCSGSLLATQDGRERIHGRGKGTIRKGEKDLKKVQGRNNQSRWQRKGREAGGRGRKERSRSCCQLALQRPGVKGSQKEWRQVMPA